MSSARPVEAVLAAAATCAVAAPLLTLFTPAAWVPPAALVVAVIALVGVLVRGWASRWWLVVGAQLVAAVVTLSVVHARDTLALGVVPTVETVRAFERLLTEAYATIMSFAAPAPTRPGVSAAVGLLMAVTALVVDALAVTARRPALAGIPLLAAYLASALNSGAGLPVGYFLAAATAWLALTAHQGSLSLRRWGDHVLGRSGGIDHGEQAVPGFASQARLLGAIGLLTAVGVAQLAPHLPTTFLAGGLGEAGGDGGGGQVSLSSTVDVSRNLRSQSSEPVLTYTSSGASQVPLRVDILETYDQGSWYPLATPTLPGQDGLSELTAGDDIPRTSVRLQVDDNRLDPPQMALPGEATSLDLGTDDWRVDANGTVRVGRPTDSYRVDYAQLRPRTDDFDSVLGDQFLGPGTLEVDPLAEPELRRVLDEVVPAGASRLEKARAIQAYLRGPQFTYSTDLAPSDRPEPIGRFLETKQGYCVQFSTAMVMMARLEGIPARMAVGFLPGQLVDGRWVVRANDAHAWPELHFPRLGWVRFEPTPGTRSGVAPTWSLDAAPATSATTSSSSAAQQSATPTPSPSRRDVPDTEQTTTRSEPAAVTWLRESWRTLLLILLAAFALGATPLAATWERRRRRRRARDDAQRVEAEWATLLSRLDDIGVTPPPGATPRQAGRHLARDAWLREEPSEALGRVVATLERARYAPSGRGLPDVQEDSVTVWRAARGARRRREQLRATLLPGDGRRAWTRLVRALAPRSVWRALTRRRDET